MAIQYRAGQILTADDLMMMQPTLYEQGEDQQVASSTSMVSSQIVIPLEASARYILRLRATYGSASNAGSGTGGARFAWLAPPGADFGRRILGVASGSDATDGQLTMRTRATGTQQTVGGGITFADYQEDIYATTVSAGDAVFQFAQQSSNSSPTILRATSRCEVVRIG